MKIFARVPVPVRKCLSVAAPGLLAFALAACSQSAEPEAVAEPVSPLVEEAGTKVKTPGKKARPVKVKSVEKRVSSAPVALPSASTTPAPVELPTTAELLSPAAPGADTMPVTPSASVLQPIAAPASFSPSAPGKRIARVAVPSPCVAVTFDDGPSASLTPQVLDIFNRHGAHATFFVLGQNANRNRSLLARAAAEGHEIGSHTWSHINMRTSSAEKILSELDRTASVIEGATGSRPKVMRPPYGSTNKGLVDMVYGRFGTPSILWDVDTKDWTKPGVQTVINRAVGQAKPGSIILLHDIHPSTIAAVEGIVTGLQARGFQLVTVSELIAMGRRAAGVETPAVSAPASQEEEPLPDTGAVSISAAPVEQPAEPAVAPVENAVEETQLSENCES